MDRFKKRAVILLIVILAWAALITGRLFFFTVYASKHYVAKGNRQAWRKGVIPAARGRILDRNRVPLAWSERCFKLYYLSFETDCVKERVRSKLQDVLSDYTCQKTPEPGRYIIKSDLTPDEITALADLVTADSRFKIESCFKRRLVDYPRVRKYLGRVGLRELVEYGVSGVEAEYHQQLCGQHGEYVVMLDRVGRWIPGTYKVLKDVEEGDDVILSLSIEEINSRGNEEDKKSN